MATDTCQRPLPAFHKINFHQIDRQGRPIPVVDARLDIRADGAPGTVAGRHRYTVTWTDSLGAAADRALGGYDGSVAPDGAMTLTLLQIPFYGLDALGKPQLGVTNEALLAIVIDRLEAFQDGPYACAENEKALVGLRDALQALHDRTLNRTARQVEGKQQP